MELARTRTDEPVKPERLFQALGDRTRLRVIALLRQGELNSGDLSATLGVTPAALSRHMRSLCQARVVMQRRDDIGTLYQLAVPRDAQSIKLWSLLADMGTSLTEAALDLERLQAVRTESVTHRAKARPAFR